MDRTLAILKPDCTCRKLTGKAIDFILEKGFKIKAIRTLTLKKEEAEAFYAVHRGKPFFNDLTSYMTSGPIFAMVLEKQNCVEDFRKVIGHTDPKKAENGTLRKLYGINIQENFVHGSDSEENANKEIAFFFPLIEIIT